MAEFSSYQQELQNFVTGGKNEIAKAVTAKGVSTPDNSTIQIITTNVGKIKTPESKFAPYCRFILSMYATETSIKSDVSISSDELNKIIRQGYTKGEFYKESNWLHNIKPTTSTNQDFEPYIYSGNLSKFSAGNSKTIIIGADNSLTVKINSITENVTNGIIFNVTTKIDRGSEFCYIVGYAIFYKP
nr:MAG TPA: hypothetical protein [Caudoviricetes sp.]